MVFTIQIPYSPILDRAMNLSTIRSNGIFTTTRATFNSGSDGKGKSNNLPPTYQI